MPVVRTMKNRSVVPTRICPVGEGRNPQCDKAGSEIPMVSRPRVSGLVNKKTAKFAIDALVEMLSRAGKPVKLAIG